MVLRYGGTSKLIQISWQINGIDPRERERWRETEGGCHPRSVKAQMTWPGLGPSIVEKWVWMRMERLEKTRSFLAGAQGEHRWFEELLRGAPEAGLAVGRPSAMGGTSPPAPPGARPEGILRTDELAKGSF